MPCRPPRAQAFETRSATVTNGQKDTHRSIRYGQEVSGSATQTVSSIRLSHSFAQGRDVSSHIDASARVPRLLKGKLFATAFEQFYYRTHRKKTCGKMLEPDLFDGRSYRVDDFHTHCSQ